MRFKFLTPLGRGGSQGVGRVQKSPFWPPSAGAYPKLQAYSYQLYIIKRFFVIVVLDSLIPVLYHKNKYKQSDIISWAK